MILSTVTPPSKVNAVALGILAAVIELSAISEATTTPAAILAEVIALSAILAVVIESSVGTFISN